MALQSLLTSGSYAFEYHKDSFKKLHSLVRIGMLTAKLSIFLISLELVC